MPPAIGSKVCGFLAVSFVCVLLATLSVAQGPAPAVDAAIEAAPAVRVTPFEGGDQHKFWDTKNRFLFVSVAALNTADFVVTRSNLRSGGTELNPLTRPFSRSTAGLAANFAGETAGVMALSYFFHRTGHHKLERMISVVSVGESGAAVSYGLLHR
jgi:hypothetical protein